MSLHSNILPTNASQEGIRHSHETRLETLLCHPYIYSKHQIYADPSYDYSVPEHDRDLLEHDCNLFDYVISRGRLRESTVREFARQIGSALDYCHKNNIVHRDLKLEHILLTRTGNVQITGFGLSSLYNPNDHLNTFCATSYFPAPELLEARIYIGPEIDVWSFGVVLYILLCGKVPFDDQSVSGLHNKIRQGVFDMPRWLSFECRKLLSRMLMTNPARRATLQEVLSSSWMVRSIGGPPDPYLAQREPLVISELDPDTLKEMATLNLGAPETIYSDLVQILSSRQYRDVVEGWWQNRTKEGLDLGLRPATLDGMTYPLTPWGMTGTKFSIFEPGRKWAPILRYLREMLPSFLRRQPTAAAPILERFESTIQQTDPTHGFHPLISVYYLVRERTEREHRLMNRPHSGKEAKDPT